MGDYRIWKYYVCKRCNVGKTQQKLHQHIDIDAYVPGIIEFTEEEIADYRSRVISLV